MCDPLTLGTLAIGIAGTAANSIGQMNAQKQQEAEYASWIKQQERARAAENKRQESMRQAAEASRQEGVDKISAESQKATQAEEAERLAAMMQGEGDVQPTADPAAATSVADAKLSGSESGGEVYQSDLARRLSDATKSAKQRIGALATANSFKDSWGGLGTVNPLNLQESGRGIDAQNEFRRGSMGAYSAEQAIDPVQVTYSNPIADIASGFLGVGLQGLGGQAAGGAGLGGGSLGGLFKGKVVPSATTKFPATMSTVPTPRPMGF